MRTGRPAPRRRAHSPATRRLHRARAAFIGACGVALALLVFEVPVSELVHQGGELAAVDARLTATNAANARLSADVAALHKDSTVAAIAHEEYGLVERGQLAYVVLPAKGSGADLLGATKLPADDLVPAALSPYAPLTVSSPKSPSLWRRVLDRLEFWRSGL